MYDAEILGMAAWASAFRSGVARTWPLGGRVPKVLSKLSVARPSCLRLLTHCARRAASRADCTAGKSSEIKTAMIAMTTSNSISVKPVFLFVFVWTETMFASPRKKLLIKCVASSKPTDTRGPEAGGSTTELEGRQSIGLGQDLGMEQRLADVEVTAAQPVRPRPDATSFHQLGLTRGFHRDHAVARSIPPLDQDGVLAGRTAVPLVVAREVETAVILDDAKRNRRRRRGGWSLMMEVNDRSRRGLTLVKHLARHRVEPRRVSTSRLRSRDRTTAASINNQRLTHS